MYKIKPHDIEEVHWSNFDATMQGRVREAVEKIILREKPLTEESLKEGKHDVEFQSDTLIWNISDDVRIGYGRQRVESIWRRFVEICTGIENR